MTALILAIFAFVYLGMAAGRVPGLRLDRTGIALVGAIVLVAAGAVDAAGIHHAIDYPTLILLFSLMVLSAQFGICGFYDWCAWRIATARTMPATLLALTVAVAGGLSAILANDVVVFAMTPMLCAALLARGLDPRPYLIGLAGGANAGSAATVIGNPQNILIGQAGGLDFLTFAAICAPPALAAMAAVYGVTRWVWRRELASAAIAPAITRPVLDRGGLIKAVVAALAVVTVFLLPVPAALGVLVVAACLLISRRHATSELLAAVDWPLLLLFAALFVVTGALAGDGLAQAALAYLAEQGIALTDLDVLAALSLFISNTIGNVPGVMLVLAAAPDLPPQGLHALAVFSTLAGNLLLVGSLANIITAERARAAGVRLDFITHARCGIPITLISFAFAYSWLAWIAS